MSVQGGLVETSAPSFVAPNRQKVSRVIVVANQKGGVGKTTTTINLGAALAERRKSTLLIDLDPQGALSVGLGLPAYDLDLTLYSVLTDASFPIRAVTHHIRPHLDLVPCNIDLASAEVKLVRMADRESVLRNAIATARESYDFVLIDSPPSLGLLTINALVAAEEIIVPLQCEFLAVRGLDALVDAIGRVQRRLNPQLHLLGILPTMYSDRRNHCELVLKRVREKYPNKVFDVIIKESVLFAEAPAERRTILEFKSKGEGASSYRTLADLVIGAKA